MGKLSSKGSTEVGEDAADHLPHLLHLGLVFLEVNWVTAVIIKSAH